MFLHTGERPYRCQSCQSAFTARDRLKGHILKHHPDHPAAQELLYSQNKIIHENFSSNERRCKQVSSAEVSTESLAGLSPSQFAENNKNNNNATNFILQWPATLQIGPDGNLCWQPSAFDPSSSNFSEVNHPQILIQQETYSENSTAELVTFTENPLDVAIKEIIEVNDSLPVVEKFVKTDGCQMSSFADKLKSLREQQTQKSTTNNGGSNSVPRETSVFICDKCGREYKYKSFLQVHQKRKCW